jgi:glycerophosphoryl diester phosphodiesterase
LILGWIYLLRIPILTGFGFLSVCYLAFTHAKAHMGGAFDINTYRGIFLVSLIAFLFASAVGVTWRLIRCYALARLFDRNPCDSNPGLRGSIGYLLLIGVVAVPPIWGAIHTSTWLSFSADECQERFTYECTVLSLGGAVGYAILGFVAYLFLITIVATVQLGLSRPTLSEYADFEVYDNQGEKVGKVNHLFVDENDQPKYIGVKMGSREIGSHLIPMEIIERVDDRRRRIEVDTNRNTVKDATFEENRVITPEFENQIYSSYDLQQPGETTPSEVSPTWEKKPDVIPDVFLLSAVPPIRQYFNRLRRHVPTARYDFTESVSKIAIFPGYITALALLFLTSVVYLGIGLIDLVRLTHGASTIVPTLGYVLLLFTLLCWGFSSLTLLLDRYRIPVLVPLVVVLLITSFTPGLKSDFSYPVTEPVGLAARVPKSELPTQKLPEKKIIVVATTGGGIQSATWTARVLTGLEEECRKKCDQDFDESIRLISAVSGGSVGTVYVVNEYKGGHLPGKDSDPRALENIVRRAQSSSLDYAVWGLLYPDLARLFIPLPFRLPWDRGWALEEAWLSQQQTQNAGEGLEDTLSEWRNDARAGVRPAVIFNTTVTETGHRLPLTTTEPIGRLQHEDLLAKDETETDVSVVTATRLSAAWPYVSPAARADVDGTAPHLVDGGYYDNYGIASLVEWLDEELEREKREETPADIKKVLVVQIHAAGMSCTTGEEQTNKQDPASTAGTQSRDGNINNQIERKRGWLYQAYAPPWTALNVRGPGQRENNEVALDLLIDKWDRKQENEDEDVDITEATFTFDGPDPPTSWHLTDKQKLGIERSWDAELHKECNKINGWDKVAGFLGTKADPGDPSKGDQEAQTPKDWPASPVNIAHRGGKYIAPENTLIGFQEGLLRAGVDVLEFDVHLTADGHLVVIHDDEVDRTTDGTGLVREMTLQEIKQLDAGYEFTDDDGKTYPYRDLGITVPTLEEVYQAFPKTPVNIEIKEDQSGIEQALWQAIKEAKAEERTLVVSGKMSVISRFREVSAGQVATGSSIREMVAFLLWSHLYPNWSLHSSYDALQVPKEIVTAGFVQAAQQSDLRVDAWTVNTEQGMRRLLGYGVDGIMTDRPDVLNRVLEKESEDGW